MPDSKSYDARSITFLSKTMTALKRFFATWGEDQIDDSGEPKHHRESVMNAFTHRGVNAVATRGNGIRHHHDAPQRTGWSTLEPEPYHHEYEEEV